MKQMGQSGFTLIELMVVVAIVAILSAMAYPNYVRHVQKAKRSDAQVALNEAAQRQERFFIQNRSYATTLTVLGYPNPAISPEGEYSLALSNVTATTYTLTATPVTGRTQASDGECTTFSLNQRGTRTATGSSAASCW